MGESTCHSLVESVAFKLRCLQLADFHFHQLYVAVLLPLCIPFAHNRLLFIHLYCSTATNRKDIMRAWIIFGPLPLNFKLSDYARH